MLEHAIRIAQQGDIARGLEWLRVLHELRSPTNYVMWSIGEIIGIEYRDAEPARPIVKPSLGAHVNTASLPGESKRSAGTAGTKYFHDTLREFFRDWRDYKATPREFVTDLRAELPYRLLWDGSTDSLKPWQLNLQLGVDIRVEGTGWVPGMTIAEIAKLQRNQYQLVVADFDKLAGSLS